MQISRIETGFIEIPGQISLNIYTQGCTCGCVGCHNEEIWSFKGGFKFDKEYIKKLMPKRTLCKWICWLGGNPTEQNDLGEICQYIKENYNFKICVYTGHLFKTIDKNTLKYIDMVVDGKWEGIPVIEPNTNQKIYLKQNNTFNLLKNWQELTDILT